MDKSQNRVGALKAERDRYVALAFCWADLLFEIDRDFTIRFAAGATRAFFGRSNEALVGTSFRALVAPADLPMAGQALTRVLAAGRIDEEILRVVAQDGSPLWVSMSGYCLDPKGGHLFIGLRKTSPPARRAAPAPRRDEASGLFRRGDFAELAASRLKGMQAAGESAEVTLLAMPDIGALHTRLNPKAGEAFTRSVGDVLKASSVGGDAAAQVADGRFSIMHAAGADIGQVVHELEALSRSADPEGEGLKVESATLAVDSLGDMSEEDLAKGLIYTLNRFGGADNTGGAVSLQDFATRMSSLVGHAVNEVNSFKRVVARSEFFVALQPIVSLQSGEIHHYEALCRFDAAPGASPFRTIAFAEEAGLIHEFDLAMAKKVLQWLDRFPRNSDKHRVAVNVSGFSIGKPAYLDALMRLLKDNAWARGKLMFEITESSRMSDLESANTFIQTLRDSGYAVCLDDFGAGAASFQYLSVLEVDVVKVDGSAIKNAQRAFKGRAFLSALTELCRRMGVDTIAEMIDSPQALEFCRDCGCDFVQGFLFGQPSRDIKDFHPLPQAHLVRKETRASSLPSSSRTSKAQIRDPDRQ